MGSKSCHKVSYIPNKELCPWRKCGETADYSHICGDCPIIRGFWKRIKEETENPTS